MPEREKPRPIQSVVPLTGRLPNESDAAVINALATISEQLDFLIDLLERDQ